MVTNPRPLTYVLHNRQGHLVLHFRIFFVNMDNENFFMSLGTSDQILGPRWASVSVPQETVLTLDVLKMPPPSWLGWTFKGKINSIILGERWYTTLYSSIASV